MPLPAGGSIHRGLSGRNHAVVVRGSGLAHGPVKCGQRPAFFAQPPAYHGIDIARDILRHVLCQKGRTHPLSAHDLPRVRLHHTGK
jgi:hypothetical protein